MSRVTSFAKKMLPEKFYARLQLIDHYLNGEREIKLLRYLCDRDRVSLDVGANIGTYTYFMRRFSRSVRAYEPNPELAARLRRLYPDAVIREAAISDVSGKLKLRVPVRAGRVIHELASVAYHFDKEAQVAEHIVPAIRVDDDDCGDVGFIKIDVEQHELAAIKGSLGTIHKCKPVVMTEVCPLLYPGPLPKMFENMTDMGYVGWFCFEGNYYQFAEFVAEIHANKAKWPRRFMNNNVIFLPPGYDNSFLSRRKL